MGTPIHASFGSSTAMTITLASLANSTAGVGRQSTLIDNTTTQTQMVRVFYKITTGKSPTDKTTITLYLLQGDNPASSNIRTDGAGASDAGLTVVTASLVGVIQVSSTSNVTYTGSFLIRNPGPEWGIAVVNSTGVALNSTGGNHSLRYVVEDVTT